MCLGFVDNVKNARYSITIYKRVGQLSYLSESQIEK